MDERSRQLSRRAFVRYLGLAGVAAGIGACAPQAPQAPQAPAQAASAAVNPTDVPKPSKLVLWHMFFDDDANKGLVIKDSVAKFMKDTGIDVELSQIVWTDHLKRMGTVGVAKDKLPDAFNSGLAAAGLQSMVDGDYVLPIDDYVTADELKQYQPSLLEHCRIGGKLYALPEEAALFGLIYNKDVFKQLSLDTPKSIEELEAGMEKMKAADIVPLPLVVATGTFAAAWLFEALAGRTVTQADMDAVSANQVKFSDKMMAVEEIMERWGQKGYYGPNVLTNEWGPAITAMHDNKIGMMAMGVFFAAEAKNQFHLDDLPWGIMVPPEVTKGIGNQVAGGLWWNVSVNQYSQNPYWASRLAVALSGPSFSDQWFHRTDNLCAGLTNTDNLTFSALKDALAILKDHKTAWFNVPAAISTDYENVQVELVANRITAKEAADKIDALFASV